MFTYKTFKFLNRTFEVHLNGYYAEHIWQESQDQESVHPYMHIKIQQLLQAARHFNMDNKNQAVAYVTDAHGNNLAIPFFFNRTKKIALIKSCFIYNKKQTIAGNKNKLSEEAKAIFIHKQHMQLINNAAAQIKFAESLLNKSIKKH